MAWVELVERRGQRVKHYFDAATGKSWAELTVHDRHYRDDVQAWQDIDENFEADGLDGFAQRTVRAGHLVRIASNGARRWIPRREHPTEYVDFGRLQSWSGTAWQNVNLGTPVRSGNRLAWSTTNFDLDLFFTWRSVKIHVVLKTENARRRLRWAVALNGLTWNDWTLVANSDGAVVGTVERPTAWDTNGKPNHPNVTITTAYSGGFVEFGGDLSAAVLPITIDPTLSQTSSTADGYVYGESGVYSVARSTSAALDNTGTTMGVANTYFGGFYYPNRAFLKFDTSSLADDVTITQVNLKMVCVTDDSATDFDVQIVKQDWSAQDPLAAGNREAAYDGCLAGTADDNIWRNTSGMAVNTQYTSGNLATAWVSKTAATYYSLRSSRDFAGTTPTGLEEIFLATANHATAGYRPVLDVIYTEAGVSGSLAKTLDSLSKTLTGTVAVQGSTVKTLDGLSKTLAGGVEVKGSTSKTLDGLSKTLAGGVEVKGSTSKTLDDLSKTLAGGVEVKGSTVKTLGDTAIVATGAVGNLPISGSLAKTLDDLSKTLTGTVEVQGSAVKTLADVGKTLTGSVGVQGSTAKTLDDLSKTLTGTVAIQGSAVKTLDGVTVSATGIVGAINISGSLGVILAATILVSRGKELRDLSEVTAQPNVVFGARYFRRK